MTDRLYFTDSDEANALLVSDPMALLIGFALDQQVPVQKAFSGPLALRERLGTLEPAALVGVAIVVALSVLRSGSPAEAAHHADPHGDRRRPEPAYSDAC